MLNSLAFAFRFKLLFLQFFETVVFLPRFSIVKNLPFKDLFRFPHAVSRLSSGPLLKLETVGKIL